MPRFKATVDDTWWETPTIRGLRFRVAPEFTFRPGQWVDLFLAEDGSGPVGGYSMTTSPLDRGTFDLALRRSTRHPVTRWLCDEATGDDRVWVSPGQGKMVLDPEATSELVLVGAGIGITPLMSMLRHALRSGGERRVTLIYGAHDPAEIPFAEELQELGAHARVTVMLTVSEADANWKGRVGRVDAGLLDEASPVDARYVLCGPAGLVRGSRDWLLERGVAPARILHEDWALGGA